MLCWIAFHERGLAYWEIAQVLVYSRDELGLVPPGTNCRLDRVADRISTITDILVDELQ